MTCYVVTVTEIVPIEAFSCMIGKNFSVQN